MLRCGPFQKRVARSLLQSKHTRWGPVSLTPTKNISETISKRWQSRMAADDHIPTPTTTQLRSHFMKQAVPMIGFGFMDQTVMLQAGNAIDCTIGVTFGLSTLTAAAFGQVCSDAAGVLSGGTLERIGSWAGLPKTGFTAAQRGLPIVKRVGLAGQLIGIVLGCLLGLVNLLWIDTSRSSTLKLQALSDEQEFAFMVEASNALRPDATVLTVRGPDVDGLLASMTAALTARGCSLVELHAARAVTATDLPSTVQEGIEKKQSNDGKELSIVTNIESSSVSSYSTENKSLPLTLPGIIASEKKEMIEDVFVVVDNGTKQQVDDDDLDELAAALLEATFHPINVRSFKAHAQQLEEHNNELQTRIHKLEKLLQERQIKVVHGSGSSGSGGSSSIRSVMATSSPVSPVIGDNSSEE